ncbi:MAG: hypothetical protein ACK5O3_19365 [Burkholderiales bacterium]
MDPLIEQGLQILERRVAKRADGHEDDGRYVGPLRAFGIVFDEIRLAGSDRAFFVQATAKQANAKALLAQLERRGVSWMQAPPLVDAAVQPLATHRSGNDDLNAGISVYSVQLNEGLAAIGPGLTYVCASGPTQPTAQTADLPSLREVEQVVAAQRPMPDAWSARILASESPQRWLALARYRHLTEVQVGALLRARDKSIPWDLVRSAAAPLSPHQIDGLIAGKDEGLLFALGMYRWESLDEAQRGLVLSRLPQRQRTLVLLRAGGPGADAQLLETIRSGSESEIRRQILARGTVHESHVAALLAHPSVVLRRFLTMDVKFTPTPSIIETILRDPDTDVQVGLLRRRDVSLAAAQLAQGVHHPDRNLAFWYLNHPSYTPTPADVERGLTAADPRVRRSWALLKGYAMTESQLARGLADADASTRLAFWQRKEAKLNDAQMDRCLREADFSARDACLQRPEFSLTQERFDWILVDANPNIPGRLFERAAREAWELKAFVDASLRKTSAEGLRRLALETGLALTDAQIQLGRESAEAGVRAAFCQRKGKELPPCGLVR